MPCSRAREGVNLAKRVPVLEDAHDDESTVEHLRVTAPIPPKKRPDMGDLVIYVGWLLAALFLGALITVIIYSTT